MITIFQVPLSDPILKKDEETLSSPNDGINKNTYKGLFIKVAKFYLDQTKQSFPFVGNL